MDNVNEYYSYLIDQGIATESELDLITSINGWSIETLNDVLYERTGYRTYEQYTGEDDEDDEDETDDDDETEPESISE